MRGFKVGGNEILIANVGGKFYAMHSVCTHKGGPLAEGLLSGSIVTCPWHGGQFDVKTGKVKGPPPKEDEPAFEVKVSGKDILVKV